MKKIICFVGILMGLTLTSFLIAEKLFSEKLAGTVKAYERTFTLSVDDCLKNAQYDRYSNYRGISCEIVFFDQSTNEGDADFPGDDIEITKPFKNGKVIISADARWRSSRTLFKN